MDDDAGRDETAARDGGFTEEYELATEADVIEVEDDSDGETEGAVAGSFAPDLEVTPGTPKAENVAFVALGVIVAILALGRMFLGPQMYAPTTLGGVILAVLVGTAALYGLFARTGEA